MALHPTTDQTPSSWKLRVELRDWQRKAREEWLVRMRGVVSVVTGGGKTVFAFLCMQEFRKKYPDGCVIILVPTITLLDQWFVGLLEDLGVPESEIACFSSQEKAAAPKAVNLLVINSARTKGVKLSQGRASLLIVDECHRAGSPENAKAIKGEHTAALGLSATPQREYDEGFQKYVVPAVGSVIFEYDYADAFRDGVITPFDLINVCVDLLPDEQAEYDKLTKRLAILLRKAGKDAATEEPLKRLLQKRAAVSATAQMRIPVAARIVEQHRGFRTIVFHERVRSAQSLYDILRKRNHNACLYHSQIAPVIRRDNLRLFRRGIFDVLISCRALDEGMNVPETAVAIIASSTASARQRIQRLGRVLRPARGKEKATVYTIYATEPERRRLKAEEERLEGVAGVTWAVGGRQKRNL